VQESGVGVQTGNTHRRVHAIHQKRVKKRKNGIDGVCGRSPDSAEEPLIFNETPAERLKVQGTTPSLVAPKAIYAFRLEEETDETLDLVSFLTRQGYIAASFDAHEKGGHVGELSGDDGPNLSKGEGFVAQKTVLPFMKKDILRFRRRYSPQVSASETQKNDVNAIAHQLSQCLVRDLHITENNELIELVGEEGMVNGIAFPDEQMPSLLDNSRALGPDVNHHGKSPPFSNLKALSHGNPRETKSATLPPEFHVNFVNQANSVGPTRYRARW